MGNSGGSNLGLIEIYDAASAVHSYALFYCSMENY